MSPKSTANASFMTGSTLTIPKLADDGSNWVDFKSKAQNTIGPKGLIRHLDSTEVMPKVYQVVLGVSVVAVVMIMVPKIPAMATKSLIPAVPTITSEVPTMEARVDAHVVFINAYWIKEYLTQHIVTNTVSSQLTAVILSLANAGLRWTAVKKDATDKSQMF